MKKAFTITIAGTVFTIEEDAYDKLRGYLTSIQNYFGSNPNNKEIVEDIEARIAERLLERAHKEAVVTLIDVDGVIAVMGRVEDFAAESDTSTDTTAKNSQENDSDHKEFKSPRKLFRNTDDMYIAGVASGLAAYFDVDPLVIRLGFIFLILISGVFPGLIIYGILALLIPQAKTPAEKMQMRGGPVTLQSFADNIKKNGQDLKENLKENTKDFFKEDSRPRTLLDRFLRAVGQIIKTSFKVLLAIGGFAIMIGSVIAMSVLSFFFVNLIINANSPTLDFPLQGLISGPIYYLFITLGFLLLAIPLAVLIKIGVAFMTRKLRVNIYSLLIMAAIWFVAAVIMGTLAIRYTPIIRARYDALPDQQVINRTFDVKDFTKINASGAERIALVQGTSTAFSVISEGREKDLNALTILVVDGELLIRHKQSEKICVFCWSDYKRSEITIVMPVIDAITLDGATDLRTNSLVAQSLMVDVDGVARLVASTTAQTLKLTADGASHVQFSGSVEKLDAIIDGAARFDGRELIVKEAKLDTDGASKTEVTVSDILNVEADGVSSVRYFGTPVTDIVEDGAARVQER
jgi:phage shock protein PspC (stress-responsive transcriptional regulator)